MSEPAVLRRLVLSVPDDLASLRHTLTTIARAVGLDGSDTTRIATAASELGRHLVPVLPVTVDVMIGGGAGPATSELRIVFAGSAAVTGIPDVHLRAARRLVDDIEIAAASITAVRKLGQRVSAADLDRVRRELATERPGDLRAELRSQNDELITALTSLHERERELTRVNAELDEANRGVIALYAEVEQRAAQVRTAQRAVFEELERAFRPPAPAVPGWTLAVRYLPAQANSPTGGDLYDWFVLPDGGLHVFVVDVQGHGVESTRDALQIVHAVRVLTLEGVPLADVLARTDELLQASQPTAAATAILARVDVQTGTVQLAGAGHPEPLVVRAVAEPEYVDAPGRPIGFGGAGTIEVSAAQLAPGDSLLLYTDGLIEIRRDILEGIETLRGAARMARHLPLPQLLDTTLAACTRGDPLLDDTLLLALQRMS